MAERLSTGLRNEILKSGGSSMADALLNGVIYIFSGTQPATADDTESGYTLLGIVSVDHLTFTPGSPTNGLNLDVATGGVVSKAVAETWQFEGITNGTAGWFRLYANDRLQGTSTTAIRLDGAISTSGAEINMSNTAVVTSAIGTIDAFAVTWPAS